MSPSNVAVIAALISVVLGASPAADIVIPAGPNSWLFDSTGTCVPGSKITTNDRIKNWTDASRQIRLYFWLDTTGQLDVSLQAAVTGGEAQIRCALGKESKQISLASATPTTIPVGTFTIERPGYHYLELTGLSKTATTFGDIDHLQLSGTAAAGKVHYLKEDFHFGRRGPSVHLNYRLPKEAQDICYFYNEITVPVGQDVIGTYAMANGFAEGYSGMQVNSTTERRILFSVWSPFSTDDPKQIPESDRIVLLAKGKDVKAQSFGGEGSGGQSYLVYPWKAGSTYRFLLRGEPSGDGTTVYTAYFYTPESGKWHLIASFRRSKTNTYLKRWHSFLENFAPDTGAITREAHYTNQWARDRNGHWFAVKEAGYTADATAHKQARLDYAGGVTADGQFFLRNAGFFSERVPYGTSFTRTPAPQPPVIELEKLPTE